jgi:hypothetical protein
MLTRCRKPEITTVDDVIGELAKASLARDWKDTSDVLCILDGPLPENWDDVIHEVMRKRNIRSVLSSQRKHLFTE